MYAVIATGGKQYRVEKGGVLRIEKLSAEPGSTVEFNEVLMVADGDVVPEGLTFTKHFKNVEGIDFGKRVEMGIRNNRYKAMVPTVTGPLRLRGRVHAVEARIARAHTGRKLKFTLPGPMTIVDTIADTHYGDRVALAMAFAALLMARSFD